MYAELTNAFLSLLGQALMLPVQALVLLVEAVLTLVRGKAPKPKVVLITGATSGIGAALAVSYAEAGVTLALTGRNKDRLAKVKSECEGKGAAVVTADLDIADAAAVERWITEVDETLHGVDLVIANAGVTEHVLGGAKEPLEVARQVFRINVDGVLNTVLPVVPRMKERRAGQIAIMSSLAGYNSMSGTPSYAATKAAVRVWAESLRGELARDGVRVNVICPGFITSPLTDASSKSAMPMKMEMPEAIAHIRDGLDRDVPEIAFPSPIYALATTLRAMPRVVKDFILRNQIVPGFSYRRASRDKKE